MFIVRTIAVLRLVVRVTSFRRVGELLEVSSWCLLDWSWPFLGRLCVRLFVCMRTNVHTPGYMEHMFVG